MTRPIIKLPFPGFYYSWFSDEIDHVAERDAEWRAEEQGREGIAPELRLSATDFGEIFFSVADYSAAYAHIAREYVASFEHVINPDIGFKLSLEFEKMTSPREYNFETDRVFAFTTKKAIREMFKRSKTDKHATLEQVIKKRFTSRSGFISYYPNHLDAWLAKPLDSWDWNELETLLLACLELAGLDIDKIESDVFEHMSESNDFDVAWDNAVDWKAFDAKVAERRVDIVAEIAAADPDYVAPPERCPDTLDMFRDYNPEAPC